MSDSSKIQKLKEISFFLEVSEHDLLEIAAISTERHFRVGEIIIEENSKADVFFIIYKGKIEILKKFEDGEEVVLGVYSDGEFFGEMAILDEGPRSATARAMEPTTVMQVSYKDFEKILGVVPQIAYEIMKELSARLRQTGALLVWQLKRKNRELADVSLNTVRAVVQSLEDRNPFLRGHSERVSRLSVAIGTEMGLSEEEISSLELGGLLHDIGMIGVSDTIINESRPLNNSEYDIIKQHTADGKSMVELIPHLQQVLPSILSHHERFDGSGYPDKLVGIQIPLAGRIIAAADVFDALITDRPQRKRIDIKDALSYIVDNSGVSFDPDVVSALKTLAEDKNFPDKLY